MYMARDFQDFVNEVSVRASIVRIASDYTRLKKRGSRYIGLCPFHEERTPSFTISPEKNLYHCFGCGVGGNIFGLVMAIENVGFQESVRIVAQKSGIPLPAFKESERKERGIEQKLYELNEAAASWFFQNLARNESAYAYLRDRGVEEDTVKKYRLGYAPDTWDSLLKHLKGQNADEEILKKSGLFSTGKTNELYDMFRGRIIFPIQDHDGRIIGFGGRTLKDDTVKYLNSPETAVFHKSRNIFGLYMAHKQIRENNCAILVEGYFDQLMMWQAGFKNTIAPLGTSFNKQGAGVLKRYASDCIIAFDSDEAGINAGLRALAPLLSNGFRVRFLRLTEGKDPDEFIRKNGATAMAEAIGEAAEMFDHLVAYFWKDMEKKDPRETAKALDGILDHLQNIADPAEKEMYLRKLADKFNLSEEVIIKKSRRPHYAAREQEKTQKQVKNDVPLDEKKLIRIIMDSPSSHMDDIRELMQLNAVSNTSAAILKTMIEAAETESSFVPSLISDRLDEELKRFFSVIMIEEAVYKEYPEKELEECVNSIKKRYLTKLREEQKQKLKEAVNDDIEAKIEEILKKIQDLACQIEKLS